MATPDSAVAGFRCPLVGQPEFHQGGAAFGEFGLGGGLEDTGGVEVLDLELFDGAALMDQSKQRPPTVVLARNPFSTGILSESHRVSRLVAGAPRTSTIDRWLRGFVTGLTALLNQRSPSAG